MPDDDAASAMLVTTDEVPGARPPSAARVLRGVGGLLGTGGKIWLALGGVGSLLGGLVELAISVFLQLFLQSIGLLPAGLRTSEWLRGIPFSPPLIVVTLVLIAFSRAISQFLVAQSAIHALEAMNARLRRLAVYELLGGATSRFVPAATVHARLSDVFPKASLFVYYVSSLATGVIQALLVATIMTITAWRESLLGLVGLACVGVAVLQINRRVRRISAKIPEEQLHLTEGVERVARNLLLIRTLRTQRLEHARFVSSIQQSARHAIRAYMLSNAVIAMMPFAGLLLVTAIVAVSQRQMGTSSLTLISFLYLFIRFVQATAANVSNLAGMNHNLPQFEQAVTFVDRFSVADQQRAYTERALFTASPLAARRGSDVDSGPPRIEVRNVTFTHPGREEPVLKAVSVDAPPGSLLSITGPSGVGKSTLLALLLGLAEPDAGEVRIGARPARDYFDDPRSRVGYVGAEPFLIAGSVRENVLYGTEGAVDDRDVWAALEKARLSDAVRALPGELGYRINEDGSGLSAGQKQRVCLARALLSTPEVLVLDEVSANLDEATEREIAVTLQKLRGQCTVVIVSHRAALGEFADARLHLEAQPPPALADARLVADVG